MENGLPELPALSQPVNGLVERPRQVTAELMPNWFTNIEEVFSRATDLTTRRKDVQEFVAINDQVLVIECDRDRMTDSGKLHFPDTAVEKPSEGIVVAHGPGRIDIVGAYRATTVRQEDRVLFGKYAGTTITLRGRECRLMREEEILGIIR